MKKSRLLSLLPAILVFLTLMSCDDEYDVNILSTGDYDDTEGMLQQSADFPIGMAVGYSNLNNDEQVANILSSEVDNVTFEYNMKHGALVDDTGNINFTNADEMVAMAEAAGVNVFGHTLVWHQNQNANYLNSIVESAGGGGGGTINNLLVNGGFEEGSGDDFTGWSKYNGGSLLVQTTEPQEVRTGNRALKATGEGQDAWRTQFVSDPIITEIGTSYTFSIWAKAEATGGNFRFSTNEANGAQYSGNYDISTDWALVSWTFTATSTETRVVLDLGGSAMTYFLDDAQFYDPNYEAPSFPANGGFEEGEGDDFTGWSKFNGGSLLVATTNPDEVRTGNRALKATGEGQDAWRTQFVSDPIPTTIDTEYTASAWMKAQAAGGNIRFSTNEANGAQYSGNYDITTDWTLISWTFTAQSSETRLVMDMGASAMTYFVDDVTFTEAGSGGGGGGGDAAEMLDEALKTFITETVTHFKGSVHAWDVVNEPMADGASGLKTSMNTTVSADATDIFFWQEYLGRDYALKAFQYAEEADPEAQLFINDYNLEQNPTKVDSLIAFVDELKGKGAKIDGIGTQMHININTPQGQIDQMFKKLAATGLLIRVSELDVKINPYEKQGFTPTEQLYAYQAAMYEYVFASYMRNVPAEQRHGITIWGVSDKDSWLATDGRAEYPLLYDENYEKKPAYAAVLKALTEN